MGPDGSLDGQHALKGASISRGAEGGGRRLSSTQLLCEEFGFWVRGAGGDKGAAGVREAGWG